MIQYSPQRIIEARKLPSQAETIFNSGETVETLLSRVPVLAQSPTQRSVSDLDYLSVSASHVTQPVAEETHQITPSTISGPSHVLILHICHTAQELLAIQQSDGPKKLG